MHTIPFIHPKLHNNKNNNGRNSNINSQWEFFFAVVDSLNLFAIYYQMIHNIVILLLVPLTFAVFTVFFHYIFGGINIFFSFKWFYVYVRRPLISLSISRYVQVIFIHIFFLLLLLLIRLSSLFFLSLYYLFHVVFTFFHSFSNI